MLYFVIWELYFTRLCQYFAYNCEKHSLCRTNTLKVLSSRFAKTWLWPRLMQACMWSLRKEVTLLRLLTWSLAGFQQRLWLPRKLERNWLAGELNDKVLSKLEINLLSIFITVYCIVHSSLFNHHHHHHRHHHHQIFFCYGLLCHRRIYRCEESFHIKYR